MNDSLRAPTYHRRLIDDELDELLAGAAAVSLVGAKAVGKSATAAGLRAVDRPRRPAHRRPATDHR